MNAFKLAFAKAFSKLDLPRKRIVVAFLILGGISSIALFQNCSVKSFEVTDSASLNSSSLKSYEISILSKPESLTNLTSGSVNYSLKLDGQTVDAANYKATCTLDQNPSATCPNPFTYQGLIDGDHTIRISIAMAAEPSTAVAQTAVMFRTDATAPSLVINTLPPNPLGSSSTSIVFTATDLLSGVGSIECALDTAAFTNCISPLNLSGLSEAAHKLQIRAKDLAGNISAVQSVSFTVNLQAPMITLTTKPNSLTNVLTSDFAFTSSAPVSGYECRIDGASFASCTSPKTYSNLSDGAHTFDVRATSQSGVVSGALSYNWTIDSVAPSAPTLTSTVTSLTNLSNVPLSFMATDSSGISRYECAADSGAFATCTSPKTFSGLTSGAHTFQVRATDGANNVSAIATFAITVDLSLPIITFTSTPTATSTDLNPVFSFTATDSDSGIQTLECKLDGGSYQACTSPKTLSNLAVSSHTFSVKATDKAGNISSKSFAWNITQTTSTINLAWDATTDGATGYKLYYGTNSNPATFTQFVDVGNKTTGSVTGLVKGTVYYFAVKSYNSTQESPFSQIISGTAP
ncbi:MAG: fibronectin type III domain-containing protein [Pseudobdellovibrionaceae bacterium]